MPPCYCKFPSNSLEDEHLSRHNMLLKLDLLGEIRDYYYFSVLFLYTVFSLSCIRSCNRARNDGVIHRAFRVITWRCCHWCGIWVEGVEYVEDYLSLDMKIHRSRYELLTCKLCSEYCIGQLIVIHLFQSLPFCLAPLSDVFLTLLALWLVLSDLYSPTEKQVKWCHCLLIRFILDVLKYSCNILHITERKVTYKKLH